MRNANPTRSHPINETPLDALQTSTYISVVKGKNKKPINGHQNVLKASSRELLNSHIINRMNLGERAKSKANSIRNIVNQ